jgi:hypothetical protein
MPPDPALEPPPQIRWAAFLLFLALNWQFLGVGITINIPGPSTTVPPIVAYLIFIGRIAGEAWLAWWIAREIYRGRRAVRPIAVVLLAAPLAPILFALTIALAFAKPPPTPTITTLATLALNAVILVLLSTADSRAWFARMPTQPAPIPQP